MNLCQLFIQSQHSTLQLRLHQLLILNYNLQIERKMVETKSSSSLELLMCSYCTFGTYDADMYSYHVEELHTSKCPHCEYTSNRPDNMKVHMYKHAGEKSRSCPYCDYSCKTSSNMRKHIRIHTGEKYSCTECSSKFTQKSSLNTHMKIHNKRKTHACTECNFKSHTKGNLMVHMNAHSGEKRFACNICPKSFTHLF